METTPLHRSSWLDRSPFASLKLNWETAIFSIIVLLAIITRFYKLEPRVMSHDENSHVYYSWLLYRGQGYAHDPVTHGPFQFHIVALSYFLFGDSDTSARIPVALFSIAAVWFMWYYRRYLGRAGALIAALMFVISPYMLYYGRYVRNESFVALWGVLTLWAILRYLHTGQPRYMLLLTAATVLHFTTKETSYIYAAQTLLFLGLYFVTRVAGRTWPNGGRERFLVLLIAAIGLGALGVFANAWQNRAIQAAAQAAGTAPAPQAAPIATTALALLILALAALAAAIYFLVTGLTLEHMRQERSFDLLILVGTLVLPLLAAFPLNALGLKVPVNAGEVQTLTTATIIQMALVIVAITALAIGIGIWWNRRQWLVNAAVFWGIFIVLYTTVFTNGAGFVTGLVGSLGYWLEQQGVNRGSQPWYFYFLIQVPFYEFLPALGSLLGAGIVISRAIRRQPIEAPLAILPEEPSQDDATASAETSHEPVPVVSLIGFWAITSLIAYSVAGEKMPWLTVHIALPLILLAGWALGQLVEQINWSSLRNQRGAAAILLALVFVTSLAGTMSALVTGGLPFQGQELTQLQSTATFLTSIVVAILSGWGLSALLKDWSAGQIVRGAALGIFALLGVITARSAFLASYVNYDRATEYLVYAHCGPGVKEALAQIEEVSRRTTGGLDVVVAFDDETTYPYWWYLRNYPNQRYYGKSPTRDLRDAPLILVGDTNYDKIQPIVGKSYYQFDYIRIWWPNQDYFNLTWSRLWYALSNPEMRAAIFDVWFNRDYKKYGELASRINGYPIDMSLQNWQPSGRMRLYVRKDIAAQIWNFGAAPAATELSIAELDPTKRVNLAVDFATGTQGIEAGQFNNPHGVAVAADGSIYVADTDNNRIQHLAADGSVIAVWGNQSLVPGGQADNGTFTQPWDVAVGPDGSVYVADTWNHRVQKFTADGQFITKWGDGIKMDLNDPYGFYGPRGIAVTNEGLVVITDTGNKRLIVFDADGNFVNQIGEGGFAPGQFNEPVGIAADVNGRLYIADTWNQRIQILTPSSGTSFTPFAQWDIDGWYGKGITNYPYIAADSEGNVFVTDPEGMQIIEYTIEGKLVRFWGNPGSGPTGVNLPSGIAYDGRGGLWVTDSGNHRLIHFTLP